MKKEIEKLIPKAIEATQKFLMTEKGGNIVQKEYDGYAASLGAAIRTSGLIPALTFYTDVKRTDGGANRYKLLQAVAYCLGEAVEADDKRFLLKKVINKLYGEDVFKRKEHDIKKQPTIKHPSAKKECTKKITHASIALKLAMRNFEHSENPKS